MISYDSSPHTLPPPAPTLFILLRFPASLSLSHCDTLANIFQARDMVSSSSPYFVPTAQHSNLVFKRNQSLNDFKPICEHTNIRYVGLQSF